MKNLGKEQGVCNPLYENTPDEVIISDENPSEEEFIGLFCPLDMAQTHPEDCGCPLCRGKVKSAIES